jgi:hypothetical protein
MEQQAHATPARAADTGASWPALQFAIPVTLAATPAHSTRVRNATVACCLTTSPGVAAGGNSRSVQTRPCARRANDPTVGHRSDATLTGAHCRRVRTLSPRW